MTVKELRNQLGLSQSQFAAKFHIPVDNIQNWEQGRRCPLDYVVYLIQRVIELENELENQN